MKTLIVGVGALGGVIGARLLATGSPVCLATRSRESASHLRENGLKVTGVGGDVSVRVEHAAPLDSFQGGTFDLVVLATKAREALTAAPRAAELLAPGGTLLPIQNGAVAPLLAQRLGGNHVVGGLSNLGATMTAPGLFEQNNAGHLLVGELAGSHSPRAGAIKEWLGRGVSVRTTPNIQGAIWSKLLLNCSVTTPAAVAGQTITTCLRSPLGANVFSRIYSEALRVALASGAHPEPMVVDPIPPGWPAPDARAPEYAAWFDAIVTGYGDLKPSMLQDFERGRATEIDVINGHVATLGRTLGLATPLNDATVAAVEAISRGELRPSESLLARIAAAAV